MSSFRGSSFDPKLLVSQLAAFQGVYYVMLCVLATVLQAVFGVPVSPFAVFVADVMTSTAASGWVLAVAFQISAFACGYVLLHLVGRSKLCLDFSASRQIIHLILTWWFAGAFPWGAFWWFNQIISVVITTMIGERLCMARELEPILLQHNPPPRERASAVAAAAVAASTAAYLADPSQQPLYISIGGSNSSSKQGAGNARFQNQYAASAPILNNENNPNSAMSPPLATASGENNNNSNYNRTSPVKDSQGNLDRYSNVTDLQSSDADAISNYPGVINGNGIEMVSLNQIPQQSLSHQSVTSRQMGVRSGSGRPISTSGGPSNIPTPESPKRGGITVSTGQYSPSHPSYGQTNDYMGHHRNNSGGSNASSNNYSPTSANKRLH